MDPLDKALFPDFASLLPLANEGSESKRHKALRLASKGNLDAAALLLIEYLKEKPLLDLETKLGALSFELERQVNSLIAGLFGNAYALRRKAMPKVAIDLFCICADLHFEDAAYNAANALLHCSGSPQDIIRAEKYYRQAIAETDDPSKKAAALVNYCEIVRDGRITGKPDYYGAIALYEQAAELGLVTAMYNVGNVSTWLFNQDDSSHVGKGIYWLTKLHEHFELKRPFLEMDEPNIGEGFLNSAMGMLVKFHIMGDCPEADPEAGLSLLLREKECIETALARRWLIEQVMIKRLKRASKPQSNTPGNNWHYVLSHLGWFSCEPSPLPEMHAECFMVETQEHGDVLFVVMNGAFDPEGSSEYVQHVYKGMRDSGIQRFFIASAYALFREHEGRIYTPVLVGNHDALGIGFIGLTDGPDETIRSAKLPIDHLGGLSADSCLISIAINRLNEGGILQEDLDLGSLFWQFGGWGMPIKGEGSHKNINLI